MKSWKEQPQLFSNGKFFYRRKGHDSKIISFYDLREKSNNERAIGFNHFTRLHEIDSLIARPISDMTDEERLKWCELRHWSNPLNDYIETPESFLYLLKIGILPKQIESDNVIFSDGRNLENGS